MLSKLKVTHVRNQNLLFFFFTSWNQGNIKQKLDCSSNGHNNYTLILFELYSKSFDSENENENENPVDTSNESENPGTDFHKVTTNPADQELKTWGFSENRKVKLEKVST